MMKLYPALFFIVLSTGLKAQSNTLASKADSTRQLQPVIVRGYLSEQPVLSVPASVAVLNAAQLKLQPDNSFVSALNTVPGVRVEERSPGSYRLSIRGSLLRSPFGIRDVKVYYDEIPLTDAGGNTYLNAIDIAGIKSIEILKGPDGSLFGANSGGVVLLNPINRYADSNYVSAGLSGGSYGLLHQTAGLQQQSGNYRLGIDQSYQSYGGYRQNSYMHRSFIQSTNRWSYGGKNELRALAFTPTSATKLPVASPWRSSWPIRARRDWLPSLLQALSISISASPPKCCWAAW
jgi:iron complex outermembrane receptor protein